jgi:hypothetical protein
VIRRSRISRLIRPVVLSTKLVIWTPEKNNGRPNLQNQPDLQKLESEFGFLLGRFLA